MNDTQLSIGYIAGVIALLSSVPYIWSILKGHTKPERATYAIWSFVNLLVVASYFAAGARETIWVGLAYAISSLLVFGFSFKYGIGGLSKFDLFCLIMAILGIGLWLTTNNPILSLSFYIGVKILGYLPTIKKAYRYPETENTLSWIMAATASTLNLFAITYWSFEIALLPVYSILADGLLALILVSAVFKTRKSFKKELAALYEI